jgi:hypothetical protein
MSQNKPRVSVQLPFTIEDGKEHIATVRIHGTGRGPLPSPATHAGLAAITESHPEVARGLRALLPRLLAHEKRLFAWMRADPANARAFAENSFAAFQEACKPERDLIEALEALRQTAKP